MKMVALNDACELITDGTHYTPPDIGAGRPFFTVKDMMPAGLDFVGCSKISEEEFLKAKDQNSAPRKGDILFSKDGTVGKVHVVSDEPEFAVLSSIAILRPQKSKLNPRFVAHYLRSPEAIGEATQRKTGSALTRIILRDLKQLQIPLPPMEEQKRIAAILDQADDLRRKRQRALDRLNQLGQAIFIEMFGDPVANERSWPIERLEDASRNITDGTHDTPTRTPSGIPFITSKNVRPFEFDLSNLEYVSLETHQEIIKRCNPQRGDILYTNIGASVGSAVQNYLDFEFSLKNVALVQPDQRKALPDYLEYMLNNPKFKSALLSSSAAGGAQKFVTLKALRNAMVPLPSIDQQEKFATRVAGLANTKRLMAAQAESVALLFASLQHRAFCGELTTSRPKEAAA